MDSRLPVDDLNGASRAMAQMTREAQSRGLPRGRHNCCDNMSSLYGFGKADFR